MTYDKPEVIKMASAIVVIQGTDKFQEDRPDSNPVKPLVTISAYESDE